MRAGTTLIELLVVLVLLGIMAGIATPAFNALRPEDGNAFREKLARARVEAIVRGQVVAVQDDVGEPPKRIWRFLPDGRGLGVDLEPLTGALNVQRR